MQAQTGYLVVLVVVQLVRELHEVWFHCIGHLGLECPSWCNRTGIARCAGRSDHTSVVGMIPELARSIGRPLLRTLGKSIVFASGTTLTVIVPDVVLNVPLWPTTL